MERGAAVSTEIINDERVRVTRFDFPPGAQTGWHRHEMDYVIVAITDCEMLLEEPDGESRSVYVAAGTAYRRNVGIEHNVINGGHAPMCFVETELK